MMFKSNRLTFGMALASLMRCSTTFATDWTIFDRQQEYSAEMAVMCKQWNLTIFAPSEKPACSWGHLYVVELENRRIFYANNPVLGMPKEKFDQRMARETLLYALSNGDGYSRLEKLREDALSLLEQATEKIMAEKLRLEEENARQTYINDYHAANSLDLINAFEARYRNADPDRLILRLEERKDELIKSEYLAHYTAINSVEKATNFISKYEGRDPDGLIPSVKKRLVLLLKQEDEKRKQTEIQVQQELKRKADDEVRAASDSKKARLQHIAGLHRKYRENLIFGSSSAQAVVMTFNIPCPTKEVRSLPLKNVMYAQMDQVDRLGGMAKFFTESRGNEIRIFQAIFKNGKTIGSPELAYEINAWGEMRPFAITKTALLNTCYGSVGPIWITPQD